MEWLGEIISRAGSALLFFHSPECLNEQTLAETVLKPYMVKIGVYMQKPTLIIPYPLSKVSNSKPVVLSRIKSFLTFL